MHVPIHIVDASKYDENEDSEVVEVIDQYITYALSDETKYPEMSNLVKKVWTHHHTATCRKKKSVTCRFNAPWTPTDKTRIVRSFVLRRRLIKPQESRVENLLIKYFLIL